MSLTLEKTVFNQSMQVCELEVIYYCFVQEVDGFQLQAFERED